MKDRDPRVDPQPGDVLIMGPQWQRDRYSVIGITSGNVHYELGPMRAILQTTVERWREWSASAEVVETACSREQE